MSETRKDHWERMGGHGERCKVKVGESQNGTVQRVYSGDGERDKCQLGEDLAVH